MGKLDGKAEFAAEAKHMTADDRSDYLTGTVIPLDGGMVRTTW